MSEIINNREYRQKLLKQLIMDLHAGRSFDEVKAEFEKNFEEVTAKEISEMEQNLIMEGMPVTEIQKLCDVHASVFKGTIEDIHKTEVEIKAEETPGHPIHTFKSENREIEKLINDFIKKDLQTFKNDDSKENINKLIEEINLLWDIDKHYSRKENLLFPYLEKYGINAPPKVMWGVDDEIRAGIKESKNLLLNYSGNKDEVEAKLNEVIDKVLEMIFKEENILLPMSADTLIEDEWVTIMEESDEIGFCITEPKGKWKPSRVNVEPSTSETLGNENSEGYIKLPTGVFNVKELSFILNTIPVDITFIDKNDVVKYFSQSSERIFARTKAVIGRTVPNCHPPASVHVIETLLADFKSGKKNHEDFWIKMGPMYVYIRYFAVRDENGEYMGTLEVTQNIKPIQEIQGEKRLLSE